MAQAGGMGPKCEKCGAELPGGSPSGGASLLLCRKCGMELSYKRMYAFSWDVIVPELLWRAVAGLALLLLGQVGLDVNSGAAQGAAIAVYLTVAVLIWLVRDTALGVMRGRAKYGIVLVDADTGAALSAERAVGRNLLCLAAFPLLIVAAFQLQFGAQRTVIDVLSGTMVLPAELAPARGEAAEAGTA